MAAVSEFPWSNGWKVKSSIKTVVQRAAVVKPRPTRARPCSHDASAVCSRTSTKVAASVVGTVRRLSRSIICES